MRGDRLVVDGFDDVVSNLSGKETHDEQAGGVYHDLLVNPQPAAVIGDALFRASQEVKLYANPGTTVRALFRRNSSVGDATFGMTISGRLVPVV